MCISYGRWFESHYHQILFRASVSKLSPEIRAKLEKWNEFDWLLYNHMNETLWRKVSEIGHEKVQKEVKHLQKFVQQLTDECVEGYVDNKELDPEFRVYQPPGVKVRGIKVCFRTWE